ncbi:MAG: DUF3467 domain-containing protein [Elusimicrobiota bacterium]
MTQPKKFQKGRRTYTKWGPRFKEVHVSNGVENKKTNIPQEPPVETWTTTPVVAQGVYANATAIHLTPEEVMFDFGFTSPTHTTPQVVSRVIISYEECQKLAKTLQQVVNDIGATH